MPAEVGERFEPVKGPPEHITYQPRVLAAVKLHFIDKAQDLDSWQTLALAAPLTDDGRSALWNEAAACDLHALQKEPVAGAAFADLPPAAQRAPAYDEYGRELAAHLYQGYRLTLWRCDEVKLASRPGESEGEFRSRLALAVRERRDEQKEALRRKSAPKLDAARNRALRAADRAQREQEQASQQTMQTAISVGATVLGALFGRTAISAGSVGRATTAARSASKIGRESEQAQRAASSAEAAQQQESTLAEELQAELAALDGSLDAQRLVLSRLEVAPRKSDIAVGSVELLWSPWRTGPDGFPTPAG